MTQQTGVRSGLLLVVLGLFLVLRTTRRDSSGRTLVDHILGNHHPAGAAGAASSPAAGATSSPAAAAQSAAAVRGASPHGAPHGVTSPLSPLLPPGQAHAPYYGPLPQLGPVRHG